MAMEGEGGGAALSFNIGEYLSVLKRRWLFIAIPAVLLLLGGGALGYLLPPVYQARTLLAVKDRAFEQEGMGPIAVELDHKPLFASAQMRIRQPSFFMPVALEVGLNEGLDPNDPKEEIALREKISQNLSIDYAEAKKEGEPDFIALSYKGRDPLKVAAFLNRLRERFVERIVQTHQQRVLDQRDRYRAELLKAGQDLQRAKNALSTFLRANDLGGTDSRGIEKMRDDLADYEKLFGEVDRALREKEAERESLKNYLITVVPAGQGSLTVQQENPEWVAQQERVLAARRVFKEADAKYFETVPLWQQAKNALETEEARLELIPRYLTGSMPAPGSGNRPDRGVADAQLKLRKLEAQISNDNEELTRLDAKITELRRRVQDAPRLSERMEALEMLRDEAAAWYARVDMRFRSAQVAAEGLTRNTSPYTEVLTGVSEEEASHWDPIFPNLGLFIGVGAIVGILLGTGLALLLEFSSQAYLTSRQVSRGLDVPLLGEVGTLLSATERRSRLQKRVVVVAIGLAFLGLIVLVHVAFFDEQLRRHLPTEVFDFLRRIYGSR